MSFKSRSQALTPSPDNKDWDGSETVPTTPSSEIVARAMARHAVEPAIQPGEHVNPLLSTPACGCQELLSKFSE